MNMNMQPIAGIVRRWRERWGDDDRGTSTITTVVTIPLFLVILMGIFGLFRMMSVKWVMNRGVREAAQYISEDGRYWKFQDAQFGGTAGVTNTIKPADYFDIEAKRIILSRLRDVFNDDDIYNTYSHTLKVTVTEPILAGVPGATPDPDKVDIGLFEDIAKVCQNKGTYKAENPGEFHHWNNIRFRVYAEMDMPLPWMPFIPWTTPITPTLTFRNRAVGYIQCPRWIGTREAGVIDKSEIFAREAPALKYRNMATAWYPTVTPLPGPTSTMTVTVIPTITPPPFIR